MSSSGFRTQRIAGRAAMMTMLSTLLALLAYTWRGNGIAFSGGAAFALGLCVIATIASLVLWRGAARRSALRIVLALMLAGTLAGAAVAAYFLEAHALLAGLALSILLWLGALFLRAGPSDPNR